MINLPSIESSTLLSFAELLVRYSKKTRLDGSSTGLMRSISKMQRELKELYENNFTLSLRPVFIMSREDKESVSLSRITICSFLLSQLLQDEDSCLLSTIARVTSQLCKPCSIQGAVIIVHNMVIQKFLTSTDETEINPCISLSRNLVDSVWGLSAPITKTLPAKYAGRFALTFPKP